ncbi:diguanylate cyclase [Idiomarina sp. HP20-50]|uniref:GGDEF domain-containing protein n=1 Tax=Idiomarina sp. HP20-50 TaxID=3070813 RepID=UPI00294ACD17|nr:diguanylate cyclase [Idiomarina sp. HP20-50]MDV6315625.1 diguanylate cyclase [Idiomarina sp. HP20-50]
MIQNSLIAGTEPLDAIEEFQAIVDDIPSIVFRTPMSSEDRGAETAFISNDVERSLGYPRSSIDHLENWWYNNIHPDDISTTHDQFVRWQHADFTGLLRRQYRFRHKTKGYLWVEDLIRKHSSSTHHAEHFVGTITVIEDLVKTREQLRQLSYILPGVLYQMRFGSRAEISFPLISAHAKKLFDISPGDLTESAEAFFNKVHPDDRELLIESLENASDKLTAWQFEFRVIVEQKVVWISGRAVPDKQVEDNLIWNGLFIDNTDKKSLELELKRTNDELKRAQQVGRVGHWQANLNTGELHRSTMVRELLGLDKTNSNTSIERFNSLVHPDDLEGVKSLERLTPDNNKLQIQHRMQHADGHYIWVEEFAELQQDGFTLIGTFRDITEQKTLELELLKKSSTDRMTGIYNRGYFTEQVDKELSRAKRNGSPLSLIILDIDHFKNCNDSYGHPFGDEVIIKIASILKKSVRSHDTAARIGGEEFAALLPEAGQAEAAVVAEKLRTKIAAHKFSKNGNDIFVTVTLGVAEVQPGDNWTKLFNRADKALYKGKHSGRNQVYPATAL